MAPAQLVRGGPGPALRRRGEERRDKEHWGELSLGERRLQAPAPLQAQEQLGEPAQGRFLGLLSRWSQLCARLQDLTKAGL